MAFQNRFVNPITPAPKQAQAPTGPAPINGPRLAIRIRQKFPGEYDDMTDEELERKVLAKYPEYKDLVPDANAQNVEAAKQGGWSHIPGGDAAWNFGKRILYDLPKSIKEGAPGLAANKFYNEYDKDPAATAQADLELQNQIGAASKSPYAIAKAGLTGLDATGGVSGALGLGESSIHDIQQGNWGGLAGNAAIAAVGGTLGYKNLRGTINQSLLPKPGVVPNVSYPIPPRKVTPWDFDSPGTAPPVAEPYNLPRSQGIQRISPGAPGERPIPPTVGPLPGSIPRTGSLGSDLGVPGARPAGEILSTRPDRMAPTKIIHVAEFDAKGNPLIVEKRVPAAIGDEAAGAMRHKKISGEVAEGDWLSTDPLYSTVPKRLRPEAPNVTLLRSLSEGGGKTGAPARTNKLNFIDEAEYLRQKAAAEAAAPKPVAPVTAPGKPSVIRPEGGLSKLAGKEPPVTMGMDFGLGGAAEAIAKRIKDLMARRPPMGLEGSITRQRYLAWEGALKAEQEKLNPPVAQALPKVETNVVQEPVRQLPPVEPIAQEPIPAPRPEPVAAPKVEPVKLPEPVREQPLPKVEPPTPGNKWANEAEAKSILDNATPQELYTHYGEIAKLTDEGSKRSLLDYVQNLWSKQSKTTAKPKAVSKPITPKPVSKLAESVAETITEAVPEPVAAPVKTYKLTDKAGNVTEVTGDQLGRLNPGLRNVVETFNKNELNHAATAKELGITGERLTASLDTARSLAKMPPKVAAPAPVAKKPVSYTKKPELRPGSPEQLKYLIDRYGRLRTDKEAHLSQLRKAGDVEAIKVAEGELATIKKAEERAKADLKLDEQSWMGSDFGVTAAGEKMYKMAKGYGGAFRRKYLKNNPELKAITDKMINIRNSSELIGKMIRDKFSDIKDYTTDQVVEFQEAMGRGEHPKVSEFFDEIYNDLESRGIELNRKDNYLPQIFKEKVPEITNALGNKKMSENAPFQLRSVVKDYAEGKAKGLTPEMTPIQLMEWYGKRANKLIADNIALKQLREGGFLVGKKKATPDMVEMDPTLGTFKGWYAKPEVKGILENYLKSSEQATGGWLEKPLKYTEKAKNLALSSGLFPNIPLLTAHGLNIARPFGGRAWREGGLRGNLTAIKHGLFPERAAKELSSKSDLILEATQKYNYNPTVENPSSSGKFFETETGKYGTGKAKKAVNWLTEKQHKYWEDPLFNKMLPAIKWSVWERNFKNFVKKGASEAEAGKAATQISDHFMSGKNVDLLYNSRHFNNAARLFTLAPSWLRSSIDLGINIPKSFIPFLKDSKTPIGKAVRAKYRAAGYRTLATYFAANFMQKAFTGKMMVENDPGDIFNMDLGEDVSGEKTRGLDWFGTSADDFTIPVKMMFALMSKDEKAKGLAEVAASSAEYKGSPLSQAIFNVVKRGNFKGEPNITATHDRYGNYIPFWERAENTLSQAINFGPPQISSLWNVGTGRMTVEEAIARVGELPLKYKKKKDMFGGFKEEKKKEFTGFKY